jgi:uncharacterized membrane protein HdeD (DUF308 family)
VSTPTRPDSFSPASHGPAGIRPAAPPPESWTATEMPAVVGRHWGLPVVLGALSVAAGLAMLAWPAETVLVIAVVIGLQLLVNGVVRLVQSFAADDGSGGERTLVALLGIFSILVGVLCLRNILQTVTVLAILVGLFWLVGGIIEVIGGLSTGSVPGRGWRLLSGALGVVAGIAVLAYPGISLGALAVVFGVYLLLFGVISIVAGLAVRRAARRAGVA